MNQGYSHKHPSVVPGSTVRLEFFLLLSCVAMASGCSSRWAMDDPAYAQKYSGPYSSNDFEKISRMAKQSVDARFTAGRSGGYVGLGLLGAEIGALTIPTENTEARLGLRGLLGSEVITGGLDTGFRLHIPSRMTPFVGAGAYIGGGERSADDDGIDNDKDGVTDESGEEEKEFLFSLYPEVGVHFWRNGRSRLSLVGQYHWTPDGGVDDSAYLGLQFTLIEPPSELQAGNTDESATTQDEDQFVSTASFVNEHLLPDSISKYIEKPSEDSEESIPPADDEAANPSGEENLQDPVIDYREVLSGRPKTLGD